MLAHGKIAAQYSRRVGGVLRIGRVGEGPAGQLDKFKVAARQRVSTVTGDIVQGQRKSSTRL